MESQSPVVPSGSESSVTSPSAGAGAAAARRMHLRRPSDRLAGCTWLARFVDKARNHLAGTLEPDYAQPFCHPLATDGAFLTHFGLGKEEIIPAIAQSAGDDAAVAAWFEARPLSSRERIEAWNALAPNLGKPGQPVSRSFQWGMKHYYKGCTDPRVVSVFTAIAYDEGFLDEP